MTAEPGRGRRWHERGTLRYPGPHLDRMPVGFDLSGISIAEGLRAAVASGAVLLLSVWLHSTPLLIAAFAANLTCFCDAGGLLSTRVRATLSYAIIGTAAWVGFGLLRNLPWPVVVPPAAVAIFLCSMARVWGLAAQAVGNVLIITVALAVDEPLHGHEALVLGTSFVAGGLWSVVLTLAIWRIHPNRDATRALDHVWRALAAEAADLRMITAENRDAPSWEAHARAHRRATRAIIEDARQHVLGATRRRGPTSPVVRGMTLRLDAAETVFSALIALSDVLEAAPPEVRQAGVDALRLVRPMLVVGGKGALGATDRFDPALTRVTAAGERAPVLAPMLSAMADALRLLVRVPVADDSPNLNAAAPSRAALAGALQALRENLTWRSAILRHGVRATVLTVPALAWSLIWPSPYAHWLTITVALTMQPYFAATSQRVIERIGGTLLGGLIGAAVAFLPQTELAKALLLVPLCVIGFSVRQISYGAYIACLTPLVVVLFDVAVPGHSDVAIAAMRLAYTLVGGLLAVAACVLLWPSWDSRRLPQEIATALRAYAALADAVFTAMLQPGHDAAPARRAAGVANNNLEAALSRALQEPRRLRDRRTESGLVIDAALRRLGGALVTLQHEAVGPDQRGFLETWRGWVTRALGDLAAGRPVAEAAPAAPSTSTEDRLRRAIHAIETALTSKARSSKPAMMSSAMPRP